MAGNYAIRKLKRGSDGNMQVVFIDPSTQKEIKDLNGYTIIESGEQQSISDLNLDVKNSKDNEKEKTAAQELVKEETSDTTAMDVNEATAGGVQATGGEGGLGAPRTADNSWGYIDKPGALTAAAMFAPGMIGLGAKAASVGINVNNTVAGNKAREAWGMKERGVLGNLGGALRGTEEVGGIALKDDDNVAFFNAMNDPNQDFTKPSPNTTEMSAYSQEQRDKSTGFLGGITDLAGGAVEQTGKALGGFAKSAGDFLGSLFGREEAPAVDSRGFPSRPDAPGSGTPNEDGYYGEDYFPDKPDAPNVGSLDNAEQTGKTTDTSKSSNTGSMDNASGRGGNGSQTEAARESDGLY